MKRVGALLVMVGACARSPEPARDAAPPADNAPSAAPVVSAAPPTFEAPGPVIALEEGDAGARPLGVVSVPLGAREPRPIMIALHGGSDHPEWACNAWRGITGAYPFLVCPRGAGSEASLGWSSPADTRLRVARAVAATRARFGDWVRETKTVVLVGFSMGATQTAYLAQAEPAVYRRISLAESAYAPDPVLAFARPWSAAGERVVFLCTTPGCEGPYRKAARNVARLGVAARLDLAGTRDHGMWDQVVRSMRRDWPWLVEGAEGWDTYAPAAESDLPGKTESFTP